jgi:hypothetical protein
MTKTEWEEVYRELNDAHSELALHEQQYNHGSNKKKRSDADRQMGYVKHRVEYLLRKYPEVFKMASGGEENSDYGRQS